MDSSTVRAATHNLAYEIVEANPEPHSSNVRRAGWDLAPEVISELRAEATIGASVQERKQILFNRIFELCQELKQPPTYDSSRYGAQDVGEEEVLWRLLTELVTEKASDEALILLRNDASELVARVVTEARNRMRRYPDHYDDAIECATNDAVCALLSGDGTKPFSELENQKLARYVRQRAQSKLT